MNEKGKNARDDVAHEEDVSRLPTIISSVAGEDQFLNDSATDEETDNEAETIENKHKNIIRGERIEDGTVRVLYNVIDNFAPICTKKRIIMKILFERSS